MGSEGGSKKKKKRQGVADEKIKLNYLYFGFFLLGLALLHVYHVFIIDKAPIATQSYFALYAVAECFLEILVLILVGHFVQTFLPRVFTYLFVIVAFVLFVAHLLDFPLVRLMDWSIWYVFNFLSHESYDNFVEMLYASHISLFSWIIMGFVVAALLGTGILIFRVSEKVAERRPWIVDRRHILTLLCVVPLFMICFEHTAKHFSPNLQLARFQRAMPWKTTLLPSTPELLLVAHPLRVKSQPNITGLPSVAKHRPNIYLFVAESLREDFITEEIAPNLTQFRKDNISFDLALASANATQISWYSLFHSRFPFDWGHVSPEMEKRGSYPLVCLKNMGYQIHVYSSARLSYYRMDELIFGQNRYLLDTFYQYPHDDDRQAFESDDMTIAKLCEEMAQFEKEEGHLFIVFLESTHFHYSWPTSQPAKFSPIIDEINYLKAACSKEDLEAIKNRYRNSIYYVDSLFGRFMTQLNKSSYKEDAVVVVTGDHGEEFYEMGHLFHASALSNMQTEVPLYYKIGKKKRSTSCSMTSHIDIFPTILQYVGAEGSYEEYVDGESIFKEDKWPYAVVARYNASRCPYEYCIHNGEQKLLWKFCNETETARCQELEILALRDSEDEALPYNVSKVEETFKEAFDEIFAP